MSTTSNYNTGNTPSLPGRSIIVSNLEAPTAQINNISVNLINGLPPPSAPPISSPVNSILTVTSPGTASFTNSAILTNLEVDGNIKTGSNSGLVNQVIKKTGASTQNWSYITPGDISPGLVGQALITGGGSVGSWDYIEGSNFGTVSPNKVFTSNSLGVADFRAVSAPVIAPGLENQVLSTTGGVTEWDYVDGASFSTVTPDKVLTSNGSGVVDFRTLDPETITPGSSNQVMTMFGSTPTWNKINSNNFANNSGSVVLITDPLGVPQFSKLPTFNISPGDPGDIISTVGGLVDWIPGKSIVGIGTKYQVLQTNSSETDYEWTSNLGVDSFTFTGNTANFQSTFDRYYRENVQLPLYATAVGGSPSIYQNIDVDAYFSVVGQRVELTIYPFSLSSLFGGALAPCYLSLLVGPSYLRALNLLGSGGQILRQSSALCIVSQDNVTQDTPAIANIYTSYYSSGICFIEITKGITGTFNSVSYHGDTFSAFPSNFMELKAPFTISYIGQ